MSKRKLIHEFSLCEPQKKILGDYLEAHLQALIANDADAKHGLQETIRQTFPQSALEGMAKTLREDSEYAALIRNLPENPKNNLKYLTETRHLEKSLFSYHIGNALYEMFGAKQHHHAFATPRFNPRHESQQNRKKALHTGTFIHKDFPGHSPMQLGKAVCFASLSVPLDDEHAPTDVFMLEDAIASLPLEVRQRTHALVEFRAITSFDPDALPVVMSLEEIRKHLSDPSAQLNQISTISVENINEFNCQINNSHHDMELFNKALDDTAERVVIGPGSLLVFCEDRIFHRGHAGDPDKMKLIPPHQLTTRILLHNSGGPSLQAG